VFARAGAPCSTLAVRASCAGIATSTAQDVQTTQGYQDLAAAGSPGSIYRDQITHLGASFVVFHPVSAQTVSHSESYEEDSMNGRVEHPHERVYLEEWERRPVGSD
jgi:hypothetical protein